MNFDSWLETLLERAPLKGKSLIVTLLGDSLAPLVHAVWLSDLIELAAPFGLNERLVRTCVFRLAEEGWLAPQRDGRRSRYSLTDTGLARISHADRRIYDSPAAAWDGHWTLVLSLRNGNDLPDRVELRKELEWEGFGQLTGGVYAHPSADHAVLGDILERLGMRDSVVLLKAGDLDGQGGSASLAPAALPSWPLEDIAARYRQFLEDFAWAYRYLRDGKTLANDQAFIVRTLLIHYFRRARLHDPLLPMAMLPKDWEGLRAYRQCRELYGALWTPSQRHLRQKLTEDSLVGKAAANPQGLQRFVGR